MGVETELKQKRSSHRRLGAEAMKVQQVKQAEGDAQVHVLQAKGEADAMKYTLPLKEKQIQQSRLEAQARKEATIQNAEAAAQAKVINSKAETEQRKLLADAEADRIRVTAAADAERGNMGGLENEHVVSLGVDDAGSDDPASIRQVKQDRCRLTWGRRILRHVEREIFNPVSSYVKRAASPIGGPERPWRLSASPV